MWANVLTDVPSADLVVCYRRAALDHEGSYAVTAPELLQAWKALTAERAYERRMGLDRAPADRQLPAPPPWRGPDYQAATELFPLLLALALDLGKPFTRLEVQRAVQALRKHDPAATVADWRARLDSVRATDSAPTLGSLVAALLPAPEPTPESEAIE